MALEIATKGAMSLDISITNKKTGDSMEINWLRNPFGLCTWSEKNYAYATKTEPKEKDNLWYVTNHWSYDKSSKVNRARFKQVVMEYWRVIKKLERGYFFMDALGMLDYMFPNMDLFPTHSPFQSLRIKDAVYDKGEIGIPMEYFDKPVFQLGKASLESYKDWFKQLIVIAEKLQDKDYKFYCSN